MFGGRDGDYIQGGSGSDFLFGGAGDDKFVFEHGDSTVFQYDIIMDFEKGRDVLDFTYFNNNPDNSAYFDDFSVVNEQGLTFIHNSDINFFVVMVGEITLDENDFVF